MRDELDKNCLNKITKLLGIKAPDFISFSEVITKKLGRKIWEEKGKLISQAAELGRRKFLEKLAWLLNYEKELHNASRSRKRFDRQHSCRNHR